MTSDTPINLLLLLPDGVGVRNFLYTDFLDNWLSEGHQATIWAAPGMLEKIDDARVQKLALPPQQPTTPAGEVARKAWQTATLLWFARHFKDPDFRLYLPPWQGNSLRSILKRAWEKWMLTGNVSQKGVQKLRQAYLKKSASTAYYNACLAQLEAIRPDIILCTHQRSPGAIPPLLAAKKLGIPTSCFIFSWDNLPKVTLFVEADHYFVWSEHMKQEMALYHPEIAAARVSVTGTPQFQPYFDPRLYLSRAQFCTQHRLNPAKQFICFTGDDRTTSPFDEIYLQHLAEAVTAMNRRHNDQYRILFRRCPVDCSDRYDQVLQQYQTIIHPINPLWTAETVGAGWNQYVPTRADIGLLVNTVLHSELTVNIGSTTALDFAVLNKPACYIRYNAVANTSWDIHKLYRFIHFRAMNGLEPVYWIDSRESVEAVLQEALGDRCNRLPQAKAWHQRIAQHPLEHANKRLGAALVKLSGKAICTSVL